MSELVTLGMVLVIGLAIPEAALWWVERTNTRLHRENMRRLRRHTDE